MKETKISIDVKISRNYNTVTLSIHDEPISNATEEDFREGIHKKSTILKEEAEKILSEIQQEKP